MTKSDVLFAIKVLRPLLILAICIVHMPYIGGYTAELVTIDDIGSLLGPFLKDTFARGAVPVLTIISGYLAYNSYQKYTYREFAQKKVVRILIPFLFWNTLLAIIFYISFQILSFPAIGADMHTLTGSLGNLMDKVYGYSGLPINAPSYFLRDLFIVSLLTPIFLILKKSKIMWLFLVGFIALFVTIPSIKITNVILFYRTDMIFFFYLGCCLAHSNLANYMSCNVRYRCSIYWLLFLSVCSFATLYLVKYKPDMLAYVHVKSLFGLVFLILVPCLINAINRHRQVWIISGLAATSIYSYTLFFVHYPATIMLSFWVEKYSLQINNSSSLFAQLTMIIAYLTLSLLLTYLLANLYWALRNRALKIQKNDRSLTGHP